MTENMNNGRVLWFDSRKGYGFINLLGTEDNYFVHFSGIKVSSDTIYKKLFPGEYVNFTLVEDGDRKICNDVTGIGGGPLLTENTQYRYKYFKNNRVNRGEEDGEEDGEDGDDGEDDEDGN
jgi:cold shock CspA family protein